MLLHADAQRRRRRARHVHPVHNLGRGRRERTLLIGLGLVFGLLTLVWFDVGTAGPAAAPPAAGSAR